MRQNRDPISQETIIRDKKAKNLEIKQPIKGNIISKLIPRNKEQNIDK